MAAEWYYTTNKQQMGPVSWKELRELADVGILKPHDMVWADGMEEWVKAINQNGLFAEADAVTPVAASPKRKAGFTEAKPPPGRRTRKRVEEDEDNEDNEEDERTQRRKRRQRDEDKAKRGIGIRIFLGIGAVLAVLLLLGCGGILLVWLAWPANNAPKPAPGGGAPPPIVKPGPGAPKAQNYTIVNLAPNTDNTRQFTFQQGKQVTITVTNTLANPNTDVDLLVHPANNIKQVIAADIDTPDVNRNCRATFVAPATQAYTIRVRNLGPGFASRCQVNIEER
jgi:hypothetical protein